MLRLSIFFLAVASIAVRAPASPVPPAVDVIQTRCVRCHGGETTLSGLDLTSRDGALRGGKHGPALVPGEPQASRMYLQVASGKMPMDGRLDPSEVKAIEDWIASGATWIEAASPQTAESAGSDNTTWWAFQSPSKPSVPQVEGLSNPIDAFLLEKLRAKKLDFAPPADHATLIRRLHFDLHGLPPNPEDLSEGYEAAVERLLASPNYGERWGRHWLDVMRFGETDGGEHNNERHTAWKYRDYVIDALNRDIPYTEFVRDQLAGDVLHPGDHNKTAATGFLVAGPWDSVTKRINKDEIMRRTIRQDELDDMVTATFAAFQALTVNCARCHDHKFDPIPTRDYYRLTAVFNGAGFGERDLSTAAGKAEHQRTVEPIEKELKTVKTELAAIEDPVRTRLLAAKYEAFESARAGEARRIPVNPVWNRNTFAPVTASHFRLAVTGHSGTRAKIDHFRLITDSGASPSATNWTSAAEASPADPAYLEFHLDSPITVTGIHWWADADSPSLDSSIRIYRFEYSADGNSWQTAATSLDHVHTHELPLPELPERELAQAIPEASAAQRGALIARRKALDARLKQIPPLPSVHAVNPEPITPTHLLDRGSLAQPKEELSPGALTTIEQLTADLPIDNPGDEGARRLALANWIADPRNPLTARVIVNRVWYYHFGSGLVNTPSDFGVNGDRPSHPELLDYLATTFMENGWSLKWLHRQILLSRAYRQSSQFNEHAHAVDADNRLLWRMPLKRMDAETLRDSILHASGQLAWERGGPSFRLHRISEKGYLLKALDNDGPEVWRRAVYRFVARGGERVFMDSFDCPDPAAFTPQRAVSNTPVQALSLLNNPFLLRQAGFFAERLEKEAGPERPEQIRRAYLLLYGREPSAAELNTGLAFLETQPLAIYARALFNSNEFIYVP